MTAVFCEEPQSDMLHFPLIMKHFWTKNVNIKKWKCLNWEKHEWMEVFKDYKLRTRVSRKEMAQMVGPQWEYKSESALCTMEELWNFSDGEVSIKTTSGEFASSLDHWAYFDYNYMKDLPCLSYFNDVSWSFLGLPERGCNESVIWVGTEGANTPCHVDTYGYNVIVQVYGAKRWTLFSPEDRKYLYETRVPYEESSIYSKVGFPFPDICKHPLIINTHPYVVTLEAGDILYVPHKWWHFVENMNLAISINTWIDHINDNNQRKLEALAMYQVGSLCQGVSEPEVLFKHINPNMFDVIMLSSSELLNDILIEKVYNRIKSGKHDKAEGNQGTLNLASFSVERIKKFSFSEYHKYIYNKELYWIQNLQLSDSGTNDAFSLILDSFTDERVLTVIQDVMKEKLHCHSLL